MDETWRVGSSAACADSTTDAQPIVPVARTRLRRALAESRIEEVVVLGRRGSAQAAFATPELIALTHAPGLDVVVDPTEAQPDAHSAAWLADGAPFGARLKSRVIGEIASQPPGGAGRRVVLRFLRSPVAVGGDEHVEAITLERNEIVESERGLSARSTHDTEVLEVGLVLRSVGYRGRPVQGVPFDSQRATIPNSTGRVLDDSGDIVPGVYTTGWIKRGPSGVIGTNKKCSRETVRALLDDHAARRLPEPQADGAALRRLVAERRPDVVDRRGWAAIDAHEREAGARAGRPRVKVTDVEEMIAIAGR